MKMTKEFKEMKREFIDAVMDYALKSLPAGWSMPSRIPRDGYLESCQKDGSNLDLFLDRYGRVDWKDGPIFLDHKPACAIMKKWSVHRDLCSCGLEYDMRFGGWISALRDAIYDVGFLANLENDNETK